MKSVFFAVGLALACGGPELGEPRTLEQVDDIDVLVEDESTLEPDNLDGLEPVDVGALAPLGQTSQAFTARTSPAFQLGTQTGPDQLRCNKTSSGQSCRIPASKAMTYCFNRNTGLPNGFNATRSTEIQGRINGFVDVGAGWTWTQAMEDLFTGNCLNQPHNIQILSTTNSCGASGTGSNNIKDYGCKVGSSVTNLTEGSGVVGSYASEGACSVRVDLPDIELKFATATQRSRAFKHAVGHGIAACLGIGGRSTIELVNSRIDMNVAAEQAVLSEGERCMLQNYTATANGQFNQSGTCSTD